MEKAIIECTKRKGKKLEKAKQGDVVKVHYTGRLENGTVVDSSVGNEPLHFRIGEGRVIPGFEEAVIGMKPGDMKTERIPAERAYGPHDKEMVFNVPRSKIPEDVSLEIGQRLEIKHEDGRTGMLLVVDLSDMMVRLDANHPLAGKDLVFDISLIEIF